MAKDLIEVRALLADYRAATADWLREDAKYKAGEEEISRQIMLRELAGGPRRTKEESRAEDERMNAHVQRWSDPVDLALARLRGACCLLHGISPSWKFDRPRAVAVDGTLLVILDDHEDPKGEGFAVVEPGDVLTIDPAPAPTPAKPKRRRKAKGGAL